LEILILIFEILYFFIIFENQTFILYIVRWPFDNLKKIKTFQIKFIYDTNHHLEI